MGGSINSKPTNWKVNRKRNGKNGEAEIVNGKGKWGEGGVEARRCRTGEEGGLLILSSEEV